jgi:hypothetical protein
MKHLFEYDKYVMPSAPVNEGFVTDIFPAFLKWLREWFSKKMNDRSAIFQLPTGLLPQEIEGDHMLYVPHQQGGRGAAKLFLAAKGQYKLEEKDIDKLKANMPASDPNYKIVVDPKKTSKERALAYFKYWKKTWENYKRDAKANISSHPEVQKGIAKVDGNHPKFFSNDFLTTVAWIESRFDPKAGKTRPYKGLFQIGSDAFSDLKKTYKNRIYSNSSVIPMDTVENPQMGNDYLKWAYDRFQNNLAELEKTKA